MKKQQCSTANEKPRRINKFPTLKEEIPGEVKEGFEETAEVVEDTRMDGQTQEGEEASCFEEEVTELWETEELEEEVFKETVTLAADLAIVAGFVSTTKTTINFNNRGSSKIIHSRSINKESGRQRLLNKARQSNSH